MIEHILAKRAESRYPGLTIVVSCANWRFEYQNRELLFDVELFGPILHLKVHYANPSTTIKIDLTNPNSLDQYDTVIRDIIARLVVAAAAASPTVTAVSAATATTATANIANDGRNITE